MQRVQHSLSLGYRATGLGPLHTSTLGAVRGPCPKRKGAKICSGHTTRVLAHSKYAILQEKITPTPLLLPAFLLPSGNHLSSSFLHPVSSANGEKRLQTAQV